MKRKFQFSALGVLATLLCLGSGVRADDTIRYVAVGDSYSFGQGAKPAQSWPALLAEHLTRAGRPTKLVANPSRNGWTTEDALNEEIPVFAAARPTFATLQIGVNDWVQGATPEDFRRRLGALLDRMLAVLPDKRRLLVVTIPDFSVSPAGAAFANGRDVSRGLAQFNDILREEAVSRKLPVVDVFALSRGMAGDSSLIAPDGLHPSAQEYALWEKMIFPAVERMLKR